MGTITVKNLSSFTDSAALMRVGSYIGGNHEAAVSEDGWQVIEIKYSDGTYTVTDK